VIPEVYTAFGKALDAAEAKVGGQIKFSDDKAMGVLQDELAKTGVWGSLGVDAAGSLLKQYEEEETALCGAKLKEIEDERKRAVEAFAASIEH